VQAGKTVLVVMQSPAGEDPAGGRPCFIKGKQMPQYSVKVKVNQIVTKEVQMKVMASSEESASGKVRESLAEFPKPVTVKGVERVLVSKSDYWIPRDIEIVEVKQEKTTA